MERTNGGQALVSVSLRIIWCMFWNRMRNSCYYSTVWQWRVNWWFRRASTQTLSSSFPYSRPRSRDHRYMRDDDDCPYSEGIQSKSPSSKWCHFLHVIRFRWIWNYNSVYLVHDANYCLWVDTETSIFMTMSRLWIYEYWVFVNFIFKISTKDL